MIFFVLSGYLVGGTTEERFQTQKKFDYPLYMISRFSRLWSVLIPSFALIYIVNSIGMHAFGADQIGIYTAPGAEGDTGFRQDFAAAACTTAFLHLVASCSGFGGNGPLWSLFHEFWYYFTFPMIMLAIWGGQKPALRVALAGLAILFLFLLGQVQTAGPNVLGYFGIWLMGVWAARREKPFLPMGALGAALVFVVSLLAWRLLSPTGTVGPDNFFSLNSLLDYIIGLAFTNLIIAMKASPKLVAPPLAAIHEKLAGFSFSLYVLHTPLINCFVAFLVMQTGRGWHNKPESVADYIYFLCCIAICVIVAWLFSLVTERHTMDVRRFATRQYKRLLQPVPE
jgi:peptidoglycan/LPS O-acetylase OafA/YrhL